MVKGEDESTGRKEGNKNKIGGDCVAWHGLCDKSQAHGSIGHTHAIVPMLSYPGFYPFKVNYMMVHFSSLSLSLLPAKGTPSRRCVARLSPA